MQELNHVTTGSSETKSSYLNAAPKSCQVGWGCSVSGMKVHCRGVLGGIWTGVFLGQGRRVGQGMGGVNWSRGEGCVLDAWKAGSRAGGSYECLTDRRVTTFTGTVEGGGGPETEGMGLCDERLRQGFGEHFAYMSYIG